VRGSGEEIRQRGDRRLNPIWGSSAEGLVDGLDWTSLRLGLVHRDPFEKESTVVVILPRRRPIHLHLHLHLPCHEGSMQTFLTRVSFTPFFPSRKKKTGSSLPEGLIDARVSGNAVPRLLAFLVRSTWMVNNMRSKGIFVLVPPCTYRHAQCQHLSGAQAGATVAPC
jgi:hypothetical protein